MNKYDCDYFLTLDYNYDSLYNYNKIKIVKNRYKKTDDEILEEIDIKVIETFMRKKKLENILKN